MADVYYRIRREDGMYLKSAGVNWFWGDGASDATTWVAIPPNRSWVAMQDPTARVVRVTVKRVAPAPKRPPSMTEGEMMRLVKYASDLAFGDGRRRALAEVCAYLRSYPMGEVWADAIERGDTRPRGEGGSND